MRKELQEWIDCVAGWNEGLKTIPYKVDTLLQEYQSLTDEEQLTNACVDLLFMRNKLEHMIKVWLGETEDDE